MSLLYRLAQGLAVLLWLGLLTTCSKHAAPASFSATSHRICLQVRPDAASFLAVDTVKIHYHKKTQQLYFSLHRDLSLHDVMAGHLKLACKLSQPPQSHQQAPEDSALYRRLREDHWYAIDLPPYMEPDFIEISYSGAWPDALQRWPGYHQLDQTNQQLSARDWCQLQDESWFPQLPHDELLLSVNFVAHATYARRL